MLILREDGVLQLKKNEYAKPKNLSFLLCVAILTFHFWSLKPQFTNTLQTWLTSLHFIVCSEQIVSQAKIEGQVYRLKPTAMKYLLSKGNWLPCGLIHMEFFWMECFWQKSATL